jgi:cell division protein FtsB
MKWVWLVMVALLAILQYRFWLGDAGVRDIAALRWDIEQQQEVNAALQRRNQHLIVEVQELQTGDEGIEAMAREDMGMIKQGETFFLYIPDDVANAGDGAVSDQASTVNEVWR